MIKIVEQKQFEKIVVSFADRSSDVELNKGKLTAIIRGDAISATLTRKNGELYVKEGATEESAIRWVRNRLASLPSLAESILEQIPEDKFFVDPSGKYLGRPDETETDEEIEISRTMDKLSASLQADDMPALTNVVYLTSDAGEGKTTLINQLARRQARKFKDKQTEWLLIPIPLGGRPFLRFDDAIVASLVNKLRFRDFYYESFIELVKVGLIIPAFDGFEEMFMESSTGEALTATGELINSLDSQGSILIAARKAYFDYKSFRTQAKLYDSIRDSAVAFSRLAISRWKKDQFVEYAANRGVDNPENIFEDVSRGLDNPEHAILARPILARRLIDVLKDDGKIDNILSQLGSTDEFFPRFVHTIIEREAKEKWVDTSGTPHKPLLTVEEHYQLLAMLAEEMWHNNTDTLRDSVLDLLTEFYCDSKHYNARITRQVCERTKQHALIIKPNSEQPLYGFDHEEFYYFFLGVNIADKIISGKVNEIKNILKKGSLTQETVSSAVSRIKEYSGEILDTIRLLEDCMKNENQFSYVKENASNIAINLIDGQDKENLTLSHYVFPVNSFFNTKLKNIIFDDCYIQSTSMERTNLHDCTFVACQFDRLEVYPAPTTVLENVIFEDCQISILQDESDRGYYDLPSINHFLERRGVEIKSSADSAEEFKEDEKLILAERAVKKFIRGNVPTNHNVFLLKLGQQGPYFLSDILPDLEKRGIMVRHHKPGQEKKKWYKLGKPFGEIEKALSQSKGSYQNFLDYFPKEEVMRN